MPILNSMYDICNIFREPGDSSCVVTIDCYLTVTSANKGLYFIVTIVSYSFIGINGNVTIKCYHVGDGGVDDEKDSHKMLRFSNCYEW